MLMNKNVLITMSIYDEIIYFEEKLHKARLDYAKKIGCDYIIINKSDKRFRALIWNIFQIYDIVKNGAYEKFLYVDNDTLITPNCPNAFEVIDSGLGVVHDSWNDRPGSFKKHTLEDLKVNSGVMVGCRDIIELFNVNEFDYNKQVNWDTTETIASGELSDQLYIQRKLKESGFKYTELSELWNYQPRFNDIHKGNYVLESRLKSNISRYDAYIIHYTLLKKIIPIRDYDYLYENKGNKILFEELDKLIQ